MPPQVQCPFCKSMVVPVVGSNGKRMCPACRNLGRVRPAGPVPAAPVAQQTARSTGRRPLVLAFVLLAGLLVAGVAATWWLMQDSDASGPSGGARQTSDEPLMLGYGEASAATFELLAEADLRISVESAQQSTVGLAIQNSTEPNFYGGHVDYESLMGKKTWGTDPQETWRIAAGSHRLVLLCLDKVNPCQLTASVEVPDGIVALAADQESSATVVSLMEDAQDVPVNGSMRMLRLVLTAETSVYLTQGGEGTWHTAVLLESELEAWARDGGVVPLYARHWPEIAPCQSNPCEAVDPGRFNGTTHHAARLAPGVYAVRLQCFDAEGCRTRLTIEAVVAEGSPPRIEPFST